MGEVERDTLCMCMTVLSPQKVKEIQDAVTIPVMAKCRIGHFVEAQILESLNVDFIDESEGQPLWGYMYNSISCVHMYWVPIA